MNQLIKNSGFIGDGILTIVKIYSKYYPQNPVLSIKSEIFHFDRCHVKPTGDHIRFTLF